MATIDYDSAGARSIPVEGRRKAWRRNFNGSALDPNIWTLTKSPGMTVTVSAGNLTVGMGTAANEETIIESVESFTIPFRVQFSHTMSQRIVNNEVYLEVVNDAGTTFQGFMLDGTTTTTARTVHANQGNSNPASPTGATTMATTSTTPVIRELDCRIEAVDFSDRPTDSVSNASARRTNTRTTLDPDEKYHIRMRFKNTGVAPLSNTILIFDTILVQDTNDVLVEVAAGRGNNAGNRQIPVVVNGNVGLSNGAVAGVASSTVGTATTAFRNGAITNAGVSVKAAAGKVFGLFVSNPGASAAYINVYNATAITIGVTTPALQLLVPAGQTLDIDQAFTGINFSTGIMVAATDTSAILSAVAPATPLLVNVAYI